MRRMTRALSSVLAAGLAACGAETLKKSVDIPPVAVAGPAQAVEIGDPVNFDGDKSHAVDATITDWLWDLGDGTKATTEATVHTYATAGVFIVKLTVTDSHGLSDSALTMVTVLAGRTAPVPVISGPTTVDALSTFTLDGTGSTDTNGGIATWHWDLGDGATASTPTVMHAYASAGTEMVSLTVTDEAGLSATSAPWTIRVQPPAGMPPVPVITGPTTVVVGAMFTLDGSASTDPNANGHITSWSWNLGDGTGATTESVMHEYAAAGMETVTLTVTDSLGFSATSAPWTIHVNPPAEMPPVPVITGPTTVVVGAMFTLNGSSSTDPNTNGHISSWSWSLGDGTDATTESVMHAYATAGMESVTLTVTDSLGLSATSAPWTITVTSPAGPVFPSQWSYGLTPAGQAATCAPFIAGPLTIDIPDFSGNPTTITITEGGGQFGGDTVYSGSFALSTRGFSASNDDGLGDVQTLAGTFSTDFTEFDGTYVITASLLLCMDTLTIHGVRTNPPG
jgi:PKD repeat protein